MSATEIWVAAWRHLQPKYVSRIHDEVVWLMLAYTDCLSQCEKFLETIKLLFHTLWGN